MIAEKGGEAGWEQARRLWKKLVERADDVGEIEDAARTLARKPEDPNRQETLQTIIAAQLSQNPGLAEEVRDLLGGEQRIQEIVALTGSRIENVEQSMNQSGTQKVIAKGRSTIKDVKQTQK